MTDHARTLDDLADPFAHHAPIDIAGADPEALRRQLRAMLTIRMVEQHLAAMRKEGHIGGPVHLGVGQEAIAVGVSESLRPTDMVFGTHRSHAHVIALGSSLRGLFAEVLGKATGLSRGMGGSMHLWDAPRGFFGSAPIVGGTVPLAVGAALAAKLRRRDDVAVAYFGDGAVEEGAVQESLNFARVLQAPVLFVCENNLFASHMQIRLRQPLNATARFADAHDIAAEVVDGNDVVAVTRAADRLIARARRGGGPGFLEAVTFRWYGHVDWREDIDVGVDRSAEDLAAWRGRDPIARLEAALERGGFWSGADAASAERELRDRIAEAWQKAMADPWPAAAALEGAVFAERAGSR